MMTLQQTTKDIPINQIQVINRKRQANLDNVDGLADSIKQFGLIHPITVSTFCDNYILRAGNNRLTACRLLGWETMPCVVIDFTGDNSELMGELLEIDENLIRDDLSVLDKVSQLARRKEIYEELYPMTKNGGDRGDKINITSDYFRLHQVEEVESNNSLNEIDRPERFSLDTAKKMGKSEQTVQRLVSVGKDILPYAEQLQGTAIDDNFSELQRFAKLDDDVKDKVITILVSGQADSVADAVSEVASQDMAIVQARKESERARLDPVADIVTRNIKVGDTWILGKHIVICGDAYSLIDNLQADALVSDPPYGIDYQPDWNKWDGSKGDFKPIAGDDKPFNPLPFMNFSTVLLFGANYYSNQLPLGGWLCWDKRTKEELDKMFGSPFELAWYKSAITTRKSIMVRIQHGGVVNADSESGNNDKRYHATQKPIVLMQEIIQAITNDTDTILDPFAGSGSTLLACERLGRACVAVEIDPRNVEIIINRWVGETGGEPCQG